MSRLNKLVARMSIIVVGGSAINRERECLNSLEIYDKSKTFCLLNQNLSEARRSPALIPLTDELLIVGGCSAEQTHLNNAERLCLKTKSINNCRIQVPNEGFSCAAYCQIKDGSTFVLGGYDGLNCLRDVTRIDDKSATSQTPLIMRLKNSSAIANNNEILLFGGWDENRTMDTVFNYNTIDGSQKFCAHLPYPIEGHTAVKHQDNIYVIGGFDGISVVGTIIRYDLQSKQAKILPVQLKIARENHATAIIEEDGQHYLFIIGGWDGKEALRSCEKFEILNQEPWLKSVNCLLELCVARNRPSAIVVE